MNLSCNYQQKKMVLLSKFEIVNTTSRWVVQGPVKGIEGTYLQSDTEGLICNLTQYTIGVCNPLS
jgi:hypothetical protein